MYKLVALPLFFAAVSAGFISSPYYAGDYGYAPALTTVAHAPVATSYANSYRTVNKPLVYASAPAYAYPATPTALTYSTIAAPAAPVATSYANTYRTVNKPALAYAAPAYAYAPATTYDYASAPAVVSHAPAVVSHAPVATSYANTYRTVNKPVALTATVAHAPIVSADYYAPSLGYSTYVH